jgi:hypothetical protein
MKVIISSADFCELVEGGDGFGVSGGLAPKQINDSVVFWGDVKFFGILCE